MVKWVPKLSPVCHLVMESRNVFFLFVLFTYIVYIVLYSVYIYCGRWFYMVCRCISGISCGGPSLLTYLALHILPDF